MNEGAIDYPKVRCAGSGHAGKGDDYWSQIVCETCAKYFHTTDCTHYGVMKNDLWVWHVPDHAVR